MNLQNYMLFHTFIIIIPSSQHPYGVSRFPVWWSLSEFWIRTGRQARRCIERRGDYNVAANTLARTQFNNFGLFSSAGPPWPPGCMDFRKFHSRMSTRQMQFRQNYFGNVHQLVHGVWQMVARVEQNMHVLINNVCSLVTNLYHLCYSVYAETGSFSAPVLHGDLYCILFRLEIIQHW